MRCPYRLFREHHSYVWPSAGTPTSVPRLPILLQPATGRLPLPLYSSPQNTTEKNTGKSLSHTPPTADRPGQCWSLCDQHCPGRSAVGGVWDRDFPVFFSVVFCGEE